MRLEGKVALITGSGTGIGKAIALTFAKEGAAVVINDIESGPDSDATMRELTEMKARAIMVEADVAKDSEVRTMIRRTEEEFGQLDVLVNNAGITRFIAMEDLEAVTEEIWDRVFAVNLKAAFFCARAAAPLLKRQPDSSIVNIAAVAGVTGSGSSIPYTTSKAALICLTKSLAHALAPEVRVNAIAPNFVTTRWIAGQEGKHPDIIKQTPLGRITQPDDIARLALALATDATFVTGQTIISDGGRTM